MGIEIREASSEEMKKNLGIVQRMTNGMSFDENMDKINWSRVRIISSFGYKFMPKEKGVRFSKIKLNNCKMLISESENFKKENIILYIHGGGFVSGNADSSKGYSSMLAKYSEYRVFSINYALAPEHKFPHGFDDCYDAFSGIAEKYPNSKIILVGESAGANLCLALAHKVKSTGKIKCVIVHSPIIDMTDMLDRSQHKVNDFTVKQGFLSPLKEMYISSEEEAENPYVSPIFGDFKGFPPTFISCDYNETLYADAKALYEKCETARVKVKMIEMKNAFHAFATIGT